MQARVIAVAEKVVRTEIFGIETSIPARDLSFDWLGDARERFHVGEHILVRILNVEGDTPEILQKRVMEQAEWKILPQAINDIANGKIAIGE